MSLEHPELNLSSLSLNSSGSQSEDWDKSLNLDEEPSSSMSSSSTSAGSGDVSSSTTSTTTPRNSVVFPADNDATPRRGGEHGHAREGSGGGQSLGTKGKRSLSELMRLHAEKGTDCKFSPEEASRVAEVLGQWINASSSPYESEDDFFRSQDDLSSVFLSKRASSADLNGRPRGQSESCTRS